MKAKERVMRRMIPVSVLVCALGAVGCGATTSTGTTSSSPVYVPPRTNAPSSSVPDEPAQVNSDRRGVIPAGQELDVRLQTSLSSETARVEQRFDATTAVDLSQDSRVLVPAGSRVRG